MKVLKPDPECRSLLCCKMRKAISILFLLCIFIPFFVLLANVNIASAQTSSLGFFPHKEKKFKMTIFKGLQLSHFSRLFVSRGVTYMCLIYLVYQGFGQRLLGISVLVLGLK